MNVKKIRNLLLNVIHTSDTIKKKISNLERNQLIESINTISNDKILKLYKILEGERSRNILRKIERYSKLAAVLPVPGSEAIYGVYKLATLFNYRCGMTCHNKVDELDKRLCYKLCDVASIEKAIGEVKRELTDCWYDKNPNRCRKRTISYLKELYKKLEKSRIKLVYYQIKIKEKESAKL